MFAVPTVWFDQWYAYVNAHEADPLTAAAVARPGPFDNSPYLAVSGGVAAGGSDSRPADQASGMGWAPPQWRGDGASISRAVLRTVPRKVYELLIAW